MIGCRFAPVKSRGCVNRWFGGERYDAPHFLLGSIFRKPVIPVYFVVRLFRRVDDGRATNRSLVKMTARKENIRFSEWAASFSRHVFPNRQGDGLNVTPIVSLPDASSA